MRLRFSAFPFPAVTDPRLFVTVHTHASELNAMRAMTYDLERKYHDDKRVCVSLPSFPVSPPLISSHPLTHLSPHSLQDENSRLQEENSRLRQQLDSSRSSISSQPPGAASSTSVGAPPPSASASTASSNPLGRPTLPPLMGGGARPGSSGHGGVYPGAGAAAGGYANGGRERDGSLAAAGTEYPNKRMRVEEDERRKSAFRVLFLSLRICGALLPVSAKSITVEVWTY